jgi:dipeptidyl aminopeptidase/acylaminoacyl peptidase
MRPADIGRLVTVSDPCVSPDGASVAFVVTRVDMDANRYRSAVWLVAADGSASPRQLSAGEEGDSSPAWSPDGRTLAFTSRRKKDEKGDKRSTLHLLPVDGPGETVTLVDLPEGISNVRWSPDGSRVAFVARQRSERWDGGDDDAARPPRRIDHFLSRLDSVGWIVDRPTQIWIASSDGSAPAGPVTKGAYEHGAPSWSPDGRKLAFTAARHDRWDLERPVADVWTLDLNHDGTPGDLHQVRESSMTHNHVSWSPDGSRIAALATEEVVAPGLPQLVVLDPETGECDEPARSLDRSCAPHPGARPPIWDDRGRLWFGVEDGGNVHLYRVAADGSSAPQRMVDGERAVDGYDVAADTVAFVATSPTELPELFTVIDETERRLTSFGASFSRSHPALPPERFTVPSPAGGDIDAWIIRPAGLVGGDGATPGHPMLLSVHGGPMTQYATGWFDEFQLWASAGYVVVYANPHGSTGSTAKWLRSIRAPIAKEEPGTGWGGIDYEDLMAVVDAATERYAFIDANRLGVLGGSYGGYMASWMIGHTDRFVAACSERAVNNLHSLETSSDSAGFFRWEIGASHLDAPEEYLRQSPISYVRDMHTPVLILHSEQDLRCPVEQADQLFVALRMLGREVEYHRFPDESHELSRSGSPRHRVQRAELILDFFDRHLKADGDVDPGP